MIRRSAGRDLIAIAVLLLLSWPILAGQPKAKVTIATEKRTFRSGEQIDLIVNWKNIYYRSVRYVTVKSNGGIDVAYPPTILWNGRERIRTRWEWSMPSGVVQGQMPPGAETSDRFTLSSYDLSREGSYTIQVTWLDDETNSEVKSNTITVYVVR